MFPSSGSQVRSASRDRAVDLLSRRERIVALTGAGCSTASGIPDYRDRHGAWKHRKPTTYQRFVNRDSVRRRYWAGSLVGWRRIATAEPSPAHRALYRLEEAGPLRFLVTQNVDGLHRRAGNRRLVELHGRLQSVVCLECRARFRREPFQAQLRRLNPGWTHSSSSVRPDGDAEITPDSLEDFRIPGCPLCGGVLKPDVVFFGENIPEARLRRVRDHLDSAEALLVVGTSLMVWSAYRLAVRARERGIPIVAVNLGKTRAESELTVKIEDRCERVLPLMTSRLFDSIH